MSEQFIILRGSQRIGFLNLFLIVIFLPINLYGWLYIPLMTDLVFFVVAFLLFLGVTLLHVLLFYSFILNVRTKLEITKEFFICTTLFSRRSVKWELLKTLEVTLSEQRFIKTGVVKGKIITSTNEFGCLVPWVYPQQLKVFFSKLSLFGGGVPKFTEIGKKLIWTWNRTTQ